MEKSIVLVGLMGAGKSSVGKKLAEKLNCGFVDSDSEIEAAAAMNISDIFSTYGEAHFREGETKIIARLLDDDPKVIATGGGVFVSANNRELIKSKAISVWLRGETNVLWQRVRHKDTRPILKQANPYEVLDRLNKERSPFYAEADYIVDTTQTSLQDDVANKIIEVLGLQEEVMKHV